MSIIQFAILMGLFMLGFYLSRIIPKALEEPKKHTIKTEIIHTMKQKILGKIIMGITIVLVAFVGIQFEIDADEKKTKSNYDPDKRVIVDEHWDQ
ncbi:hypothetical protein DXB51_11410 [Bacillus cereus]|uniref:Uncharacterized protein n=1 Tax=Bacillus luti TaxID=2026191 RepID=A0ABU8HZ94_9BACI|nr:hypothetical protein [Bacillus luti]RGN77918.1 hypothetical protein DXB51_11410 [Bacillus cereus]